MQNVPGLLACTRMKCTFIKILTLEYFLLFSFSMHLFKVVSHLLSALHIELLSTKTQFKTYSNVIS